MIPSKYSQLPKPGTVRTSDEAWRYDSLCTDPVDDSNCPRCQALKQLDEYRKRPLGIFDILADGLDAVTDGRGWNSEHEKVRQLADAAPELLAALEDALFAGESGILPPAEAIAEWKRAIAKAEGKS